MAYERAQCRHKYTPTVVNDMVIRIDGTVAIVALLRNSESILPSFQSAIFAAAKSLGPSRVFVSILESGSRDNTARMLARFSTRLSAFGVRNTIQYKNPPGLIPFHEGQAHSGNRIEFLAGLRNAVLEPVLRQNRSFAKVVFLNDVILCGGDILRLLSHDVDMACAYDFNFGSFWDNWVYEALPGSRNVLKEFSSSIHRAPAPLQNENVVPVISCWNGAVAFRAEVLYNGVRFRRGYTGANDCAQSECSLFCLDIRKLGYTTIIADPTVQVFYQKSSEVQFRYLSHRPRELVSLPLALPTSWRCCELNKNGQRYIDWNKCFRQQLHDRGS